MRRRRDRGEGDTSLLCALTSIAFAILALACFVWGMSTQLERLADAVAEYAPKAEEAHDAP